MTVSEAGRLATGSPVYVISSRISGPKCGEGLIAAVVADGHGGYHSALETAGDELRIYPDGRASVILDFHGDPGFTLLAYRFDGTVYRKFAACSFENRETLAFAAGASSGTVTGYLERPDASANTYGFVARAGQAISVKVHGARGDAPPFSITDAWCGNVVTSKMFSWNGTLPTSGEFFITIKLPQNVRDQTIYKYSMTVSII
jgi:hypothetical protein